MRFWIFTKQPKETDLLHPRMTTRRLRHRLRLLLVEEIETTVEEEAIVSVPQVTFVDWVKATAEAGLVAVGLRHILSFFRACRHYMKHGKPKESPGITIMNGEARTLLEAIGRIEKRLDEQTVAGRMQAAETAVLATAVKQNARATEFLAQRVSNIENRLAV
jgi:hypothetical protein